MGLYADPHPHPPTLTYAASGVGQQNSTLISASGNSVSWRTQWSWQNNPNNVKSYANVLHNSAKGIQVRLSTLPPRPAIHLTRCMCSLCAAPEREVRPDGVAMDA